TRPTATGVHPLAAPRFDRGPVEASFRLDHITILMKPSKAQQAELDRLLADQQNPGSPQFHKWLTPEEFGNRFGLSPNDHAKVLAWLESAGLTVKESARARNWIAFGGTADKVQRALGTSIHRYQLNGEAHYANLLPPEVP